MKKFIVASLILLIVGAIAYASSLFYFNNLTKDIQGCPLQKSPVCAYDDYTYVNDCFMKKAGATKRYDGECSLERDAIYTTTTTKAEDCDIRCFRYDPVCGTDGNTYGCGEADANCHKVEVSYKGECKPEEGCICTMQYSPVCGKNGKTYGNACVAKCAKAEIDYNGECGTATQVVDPCLLSDTASREKCKLKQ